MFGITARSRFRSRDRDTGGRPPWTTRALGRKDHHPRPRQAFQELAGLPCLQPPVGATPGQPLAGRERQLAPAEPGKPRHDVLDQRPFVRLDCSAAEPPRDIGHGRLLSTLRCKAAIDLSSGTFNKLGMLPARCRNTRLGAGFDSLLVHGLHAGYDRGSSVVGVDQDGNQEDLFRPVPSTPLTSARPLRLPELPYRQWVISKRSTQ